MDVKQLAARLARECSNQRIEFSDVTAHLFTPAQLETLVRRVKLNVMEEVDTRFNGMYINEFERWVTERIKELS